MNMFLKVGDSIPRDECISNIVQMGDFVYMSAQTGRGITFQEQAVTACYRVMDVLKDLDLRMDHLVKYTVYLTDMENRDAFLGVFKNYVEAPYPAVTIVEVSGLENDAMVAIEGQGVNTLRHERTMSNSHCADCDDDTKKDVH